MNVTNDDKNETSVVTGESSMRCDHCDLVISPADLVVDEIDGVTRKFCCQGCRGAFRIITGCGLGRFYQQRTWDEPGLPAGAFKSQYDNAYLEKFVQLSGH